MRSKLLYEQLPENEPVYQLQSQTLVLGLINCSWPPCTGRPGRLNVQACIRVSQAHGLVVITWVLGVVKLGHICTHVSSPPFGLSGGLV